MVKQAVILMPEGKDNPLPPYLFAPVAGLPLLYRQIHSLRQARVATVNILVPFAARAELERQLAMDQSLIDSVKIFSHWDTFWHHTSNGAEVNPRLALLANALLDPKFLAEFVHYPVPSGSIALGFIAPPAADHDDCHHQDSRGIYSITLEDNLVTSLRSPGSRDRPRAIGLALFSQDAWQGWQEWQTSQRQSKRAPWAPPERSLFRYIAREAKEHKVLGVESGPYLISSIHHEQDLAWATSRLIASTDGSPLGNGHLESSLNRRLARKILPWVLSRPITPNQITISSLLPGLVAVFGFAQGTYGWALAAALLLPMIMVLDCLDGMVARLKFQETRGGALFDLYGDTILNLLIFWGIAIGQYRASGRPLFLELLLPLTLGYLGCWWVLEPPGVRQWKPGNLPPVPRQHSLKFKRAGKMLEEATSRDFFYLILLFALCDCLDWMIMAVAVGTNIFALLLYWRHRHDKA